MQKKLFSIFAILILGLTACTSGAETEPTETAVADYVPIISVTGEVVPAVWATISAQAGGQVREVAVETGTTVAAGDALITLEDAEAQLAVQQAEAALASARARRAELAAGPRAEQIAAAEASVAVAEAALHKVLEGADDQQIIAARAEMENAQAALAQAQSAYDQVKWRPEISMLPQSLQLEQATNTYVAAEARYRDLIAGPSNADVQQAEAQLAQAEAQLVLTKAGPTDETLDIADTEIHAAEVALAQAQLTLERTVIRAPFAGTVGLVEVRAGEVINPSQPLLVLGDLSTLRVETTDLDEIDVAQIAVGEEATVTFDALTDRTFVGQITRIAPMADPGAGGVSYRVVLEVDDLDPAIRWGMTAFVDMETE